MNVSEPSIVLVDMDNVLAGFDAEILSRVRDQYPHIVLRNDRKNFYIGEDYPEHAKLVRALSDKEGFFAALPVADYALEGWQRLIDLGYHPRICSSPLTTNPHSKTEKLDWLAKHFVPVFGQYIVEEAAITRDKYKIKGIALIDDRPKLKNSEQAVWQHIVFDKQYNRGSTQPRLYGWLDNNLSSLLEAADNRRYLRGGRASEA